MFGKTEVFPGQYGVDCIAIHHRAHIDEFVAGCIATSYGEIFFPGIREAKMVFMDSGTLATDQKSALAYLSEEKTLLIGLGDSPFNEHRTPTRGRIKAECATSLTAILLGVDREQHLAQLLNYTRKTDTTSRGIFELSSLIKLRWRRHRDEPRRVIEWVMEIIRDIVDDQLDFWEDTGREFEEKACLHSLEYYGREKTIPLAVIESDDERVNAYARMAEGKNVAVIIQKFSSGHVCIFSNKRYHLDMANVAWHVRETEAWVKVRGENKIIFMSAASGQEEGTIPQVPEWHYWKEGEAMLNGGLSARTVPPTKLSVNEILQCVRRGFKEQPPRRPQPAC